MPNPFTPRIGGTLSADIAVPDHAREVRFYARVLTTGDAPLWRDDLMNAQGTPIIGLGARTPEYADLPLQWMPHIQVADVAASAARAVERGGSELMHGKADDGTSQWAVLRDPNGAAFGIIPVVAADALPSIDDASAVGCIAWLDLTVDDADATRDFYREVIGWSVEDVAMKDAGASYADYDMRADDGTPAAGICHARGGNRDLPPVWMLYLPVGDLAESLRRVRDEGGTISKDNSGGAGGTAYAVIEDPVGVAFALVQA